MPAIKFIPNEAFPLKVPIHAPVNGAGTGIDYEIAITAAAARKGFPKMTQSGWIATMGDEFHDPRKMLQEFNDAAALYKEEGIPFIAAFWQNANFSVAWAIYTKG